MNTAVNVLEYVTKVTALGVRFWDEILGAAIGDGLNVVAYPETNLARRIPARRNYSGIYFLQHLPGLREAENGKGDDVYWNNPPAQKTFVIEVTDAQQRFQPFTFSADLPGRGLFSLACLPPISPPASEPFIPLYTSATRPVPGAMAVIRAELFDATNNKPAAWAVLEAHLNGITLAKSFADERGRVALIFAYPEPLQPFSLSPPSSNHTPLVEQEWQLELHAFYLPALAAAPFPKLCEVLAQPAAKLWKRLAPDVPFPEATLAFGKELVLKSESRSVLFLKPRCDLGF